MKRFLLASVATVGLTFAALPAMAQVAIPVPATPPMTAPTVAPQPDAEVTTEQDVGVAVEAPEPQGAAPMPDVQAQENTTLAVPTSAASVCEPRTTSVHFGARGSALTRQNQNAIEYAVDAASVCDLQTITITDSAEGRISSRRAEAVRATLVRQGIPAERITVAQANADPEAASTGRLDVRMAFAGVAEGGSPATAAASPAATPAPAPEAPPTITPETPDVAAPEGGPEGEEDADPTPST